ncbi:MAG: hypothetical protein J0L92_22150 [Deltaproteobacteria bacterium]|nr:hypothetical protein [Deltaproteobacteria bacterium]
MRARTFVLALLLFAACDPARDRRDAGSTDHDALSLDVYVPPGVDADLPPPPDAHVPPGVDAHVAEGLDAGPPSPDASTPPLAFCRTSCAAAADCATAGLALYDASHYTCDAGVCRWTGCRNDGECRTAFGRDDYACRDVAGFPSCLDTCSTSAECGSGTAAFDTDNYECVGGVCEYRGCRHDAECAATFSSSAFVCRRATLPDTGLPVPTAERNCVHGCVEASDCATSSGAFDADNYTCSSEGACVYAGCNDDAECRASFMADDYVCR